MIAHVEGTIIFRGNRYIILDVGGLGYRIFLTKQTLGSVPEKGKPMELFTHQYIREELMELYGFRTLAELEFFEALVAISGIGPKSALSIMGVAPLDTLKRAIAAGEITHLVKVSGVGKKIAEKVIIELRDKLSAGGIESDAYFAADADALEALIMLGYTKQEAREVLRKVPENITDVEKRIAEALRILGKA